MRNGIVHAPSIKDKGESMLSIIIKLRGIKGLLVLLRYRKLVKYFVKRRTKGPEWASIFYRSQIDRDLLQL